MRLGRLCKGIDFDEFVDYLFGLYTSEPTCSGWICNSGQPSRFSVSSIGPGSLKLRTKQPDVLSIIGVCGADMLVLSDHRMSTFFSWSICAVLACCYCSTCHPCNVLHWRVQT